MNVVGADRAGVRRSLLLAAWAALLLVGPLLRLFDVPARPSWNMYRGYMSGLCVVHTYERDATGALREVDRLDLLGYAGREWAAPDRHRRAKDRLAADAMIEEICTKRSAARNERPLFVDVRCGKGGAWRPERTPDVDACAARGPR